MSQQRQGTADVAAELATGCGVYDMSVPDVAHTACEGGRAGNGRICWEPQVQPGDKGTGKKQGPAGLGDAWFHLKPP